MKTYLLDARLEVLDLLHQRPVCSILLGECSLLGVTGDAKVELLFFRRRVLGGVVGYHDHDARNRAQDLIHASIDTRLLLILVQTTEALFVCVIPIWPS